MPELKCPRCGRAISTNDTVAFNGNRIFHLDCDRPRDLNYEERVLLYQFC
jgi:hypothetical protein